MQKNIKTRQGGFSFVELMIVIAIIAILSMIGVGGYNSAMRKSRDSRRKSDIQAIYQALTLYRVDRGRYPSYNNYKAESGSEAAFGNYIQKQQLFDPRTKAFSWTGNGVVPYSYFCVGAEGGDPVGGKGCRQFIICGKMEAADGGNFEITGSDYLDNNNDGVMDNALALGPTTVDAVGKIVARTTAGGNSLGEWYCAVSQ